MEVTIRDPYTYDPVCALEATSKECPEFVPGQSFSIADLLERFTRGQRLPGINMEQPNPNYVGPGVPDEELDDAPPIALDIVDVEALDAENQAIRRERQQVAEEAARKAAEEAKKDVEPGNS